MNELKKQVQKLIDLNKDNLMDSQKKYGGVYLALIEMKEDDCSSIEVELDEGSLAFTLSIPTNSCYVCQGKEFSANQVCRVNVVVDSQNNFLRNESENMESSVYDSDNPFGPYSCLSCGEEYEDIDSISSGSDSAFNLVNDMLKENGIDVYNDRSNFEDALASSGE